MKEAFAGGGGDYNPPYANQVQQVAQIAYETTTDKWADLVNWIGEIIGFEWVLLAAFIGMPFTIMAILRKLGFMKKS